ncbi:MAG: hypothetical protein L6Q55_11455 [Azonexus sp.]|nr:hypothetical protein [Azonexus sp.]MCK6413025.1 hypothetical protein [Azonexus sp.]
MKAKTLVMIVLGLSTVSLWAQTSQRTRVQGNTEITASTNNMTAIATGENTVAKNRVGVVQGDVKNNTRISVSATNVTTIVGGRNKKACTNIGGIVSNECK